MAATIFRNEISPLFDAAGTLWVFDLEPDAISAAPSNTQHVEITDFSTSERAAVLSQYQVQLLLCGAMSSEAQTAVTKRGIEIRAWLSGPLSAILNHLKTQSAYPSPGSTSEQSSRDKTLGFLSNSLEIKAYLQSCRNANYILKLDGQGHVLDHADLNMLPESRHNRDFSRPEGYGRGSGRGQRRMQNHSRWQNEPYGPMLGQSQRIIEAMQTLGVQDLLCAHCGPNALGLIQSAGLQVYLSERERLVDALRDYTQKKAQVLDFNYFNSVHSRSGRGPGRGCGRGRRRR